MAAETPRAGNSVRWLGHATALIELDGLRLLTDPLLTDRLAPFIRRRAPSLRGPHVELGPLDAVLISHAHQDHLHLPSLRQLQPGTRLVVPRGAATWLRDRGIDRVEEVRPGDRVRVGPLTIHVTPADHQGFRLPFGPRAATLGYIVEGSVSVYFGGDTDVFPGMSALPALVPGGLDLALLPVGGWGPTLRGGHMDPERAARAVQLLQAQEAIPIHWGTYWPVGLSRIRRDRFAGPGEAFRAAAARQAPEVRVHVLRPGESMPIAPAVPVTSFPEPPAG